MRLTKNIREAFVRAAMNDVPEIDYAQQARDIAIKATNDEMPDAVKKLAANEKTARWLNRGYVYLPGRLSSVQAYILEDNINYIEQKCPVVWNRLRQLAVKHEEQRIARETLRQKLIACAESVTTRKALAELLPEFEKYLPADDRAAIKTLPAVANVVADFAAAGWPKGKQTKKAA